MQRKNSGDPAVEPTPQLVSGKSADDIDDLGTLSQYEFGELLIHMHFDLANFGSGNLGKKSIISLIASIVSR